MKRASQQLRINWNVVEDAYGEATRGSGVGQTVSGENPLGMTPRGIGTRRKRGSLPAALAG